MRKLFLFFVFILAVLHHADAQSPFVGGVFPTIDHSGSITKRLDYGLYYFGAFPLVNFQQPRISKDSRFLLLYLEQSMTLNLNKHLSYTGSYVYQRENVTQANFSNEHRLYVQATYKFSTSKVNFKNRLRFDNRFIHNRATGETPYTHRLRYLVGLDFPIGKGKTYFTGYEEAFFNTFRGANAIFGENWAYAAFGLKLSERHKFEAGPLYITWNTGGTDWFHQLYLQMTWVSHLDFAKAHDE